MPSSVILVNDCRYCLLNIIASARRHPQVSANLVADPDHSIRLESFDDIDLQNVYKTKAQKDEEQMKNIIASIVEECGNASSMPSVSKNEIYAIRGHVWFYKTFIHLSHG